MLARDWFYNQRRKVGIDRAVASLYERHGDSDLRARDALAMLGVRKGWRIADIGCGNGALACEAALMGAEVDAIDISPAMLALAEISARDRKVAIRTQSAGLLSFAYQPSSYDLIVSEFTLHHLPDFWKAVAMSRIFAALKPGGFLVIADHSAKPGAGTTVSKTLHRIDEATLRQEIEAAGFKLVDEGDFLHHPEDPRDVPVFHPAVPVDEFVLKFQKPA